MNAIPIIEKILSNEKFRLNKYPAEGLAEYFSKSEVMKNLFNYSTQFYETAFLKSLPFPGQLKPELKSIIALTVDQLDFDRKKIL